MTRDGFDFTRNALSQLSLGALGWIQVTVFLLTGLLVIAGAIAIRQALRDAPGRPCAMRQAAPGRPGCSARSAPRSYSSGSSPPTRGPGSPLAPPRTGSPR
ncbi:DUF998 domain-containing protein [Streptomyces sp. NPDC060322]|uniref:DUF998 domain-containing protein n=1 Tax=Streptomyces sp. NPDC060322 TaxID=3347097 RepID=UPI00365FA308